MEEDEKKARLWMLIAKWWLVSGKIIGRLGVLLLVVSLFFYGTRTFYIMALSAIGLFLLAVLLILVALYFLSKAKKAVRRRQ